MAELMIEIPEGIMPTLSQSRILSFCPGSTMRLLRACVVIFIAFFAGVCAARVARMEITSRADLNDGRSFGLSGAYEKSTGQIYFKVEPRNLHSLNVVDLDKA